VETGDSWTVEIAEWTVSYAELHLHDLRNAIRPGKRNNRLLPGPICQDEGGNNGQEDRPAMDPR